jgi:hypothetical protein
VDRWLKKEGDAFASGESLCEVTVGGVTVGMNIKEPGILARRTAREGQIISVGEELGLAVDGKAAYMTYIENLRVEAEEKQFMDALQDLSPSSVASGSAVGAAVSDSAGSSANVKVALLREIKRLAQKGDIDESKSAFHPPYVVTCMLTYHTYIHTYIPLTGSTGSPPDVYLTDSSRVLMGMARRGDAAVSDLFLASFDSAALDPATFDANFFAENAAALVHEEMEKMARASPKK